MFLLPLSLLVACSTKGDYDSSPETNYRALWKILDEGYCYFDEKLPPDSTWAMMYDKHFRKIKPEMTNDELFDTMRDLLSELKDGHVTLYSAFDVGWWSNWRTKYPSNLDQAIRYRYLGDDSRMAGSLLYNKIIYNNHEKDRVGLIIYNSFMSPIASGNISSVFLRFKECRGIIIDARGNGGGNLHYAELLASHFAEKRTLVGYMRYKTGPGHRDFSHRQPMHIDTVKQGIKWFRPIVVLTNRGMYSAANDFSMFMKELPYATLVGDTTGGGGGLPRSSELPNSWKVRYSGSITTDINDGHVEFGVAPDIVVSLRPEDVEKGEDTLMEEAIRVINRCYERATSEEQALFSAPILSQ